MNCRASITKVVFPQFISSARNPSLLNSTTQTPTHLPHTGTDSSFLLCLYVQPVPLHPNHRNESPDTYQSMCASVFVCVCLDP